MVGRLIQIANSAHRYPLIVKPLRHTPHVQPPDRALAQTSVKPGDTVGVLDWDSSRSMMGIFSR
jgi:fatty-acyl-CoA synthase